MDDPRSDDTLMLTYRDGDAAAFEALYGRYRKPLYRYFFYALRGDRALADECFQDVWSRIIQAKDRYKRGAGFKRYLFRIARNRLVDHWRKAGRTAEESDEQLEHHPGPETGSPDLEAERDQLREELINALRQLPPDQQEAFLLQQEAGLTLEQIARHTQVGRETVKSRLRYAVNKLRTQLSPGSETPEP
jgi:RNA polymerase sigma-70 factor (ECF subfamily)